MKLHTMIPALKQQILESFTFNGNVYELKTYPGSHYDSISD